ncbi:invasion associated locus B family protein [Oleisolibacter albus]|uniref:invasion associated locus B family protein n=1 Tax=Oleisolibacter albus TaxID=2171757 RepID=UPI001EFC737F|nr:invasion associated locus B family protein [Oleisolibacter albus]
MTLRFPKAVLPVLALGLSPALLAPLLPAAANAAAAEPVLLGSFRDWSAFQLTEADGTKACWMASRPKSQSGDPAKRGEVFALVTHRPAEKALDVISVLGGYTYDKDKPVTLKVGRESFTLVGDGDTAWARDAQTDQAVSQAIRHGSTMVVTATTSRGSRTSDTYSLAGSGAAYQAMSRACGIGP